MKKIGRPRKNFDEGWQEYTFNAESKKTGFVLTHNEVADAIKRFKEKGGKIKKLPPAGENFLPKYHSENFRNMRPT
jgi:hypothetical protein